MGVREKYQDKVEAQLHEWREWIANYEVDPSITDLRKTADRQNAADRQQMMDRLNDCQAMAQIRLEDLRSSKDEQWELAKQAVERAMIDLKRLLDESGAAHTGRSLPLQTSRSHVYDPFAKRG